jgi:hypothetical protein
MHDMDLLQHRIKAKHLDSYLYWLAHLP